MADISYKPQTITLNNVSLSALDTAVVAETKTLIAAGSTNVIIQQIVSYTVGSTLTYSRCINFNGLI